MVRPHQRFLVSRVARIRSRVRAIHDRDRIDRATEEKRKRERKEKKGGKTRKGGAREAVSRKYKRKIRERGEKASRDELRNK